MRRSNIDPTSAGGQDSFLDIVANIVGILIILVVVTGVRVKHLDFESRPLSEKVQRSTRELYQRQARVASMRGDLIDTSGQIASLKIETTFLAAEQEQLARAVAFAEYEIENRRNDLDADGQVEFDMRRAVAEAQAELDDLGRKLAHPAEPRKPPLVVVENYPTPLSETVDGSEFHFQRRGGRVAFIPLDSLIRRFTKDAQWKLYQMRDQMELSDTVGPDGGFRLRYTLQRYDLTPQEAMAAGHGGSRVRLKRWTLIPVSNSVGDPVEEALAEGSEFRRRLKEIPPDAVLTVWTYPDSFKEYRQLVKAVYHQGYACAARPLPHGAPISGSPEGTKSAAQ